MYEEDSIYDGKPLITPRNPYKPKLKKIRYADPKDKFYIRVARKSQYVCEDTASFISDFFHGRSN
jgi:hypothetical protein